MTENLRPEVNKFILNAAIKKIPVFEAYRNLCQTRPGKFDFPDFEWKYYQYYHGRKSEKSPLKFSDLPVDVLAKVVAKLNILECMRLRTVCRDLRNLVDSSEIRCGRIGFRFDPRDSTIEIAPSWHDKRHYAEFSMARYRTEDAEENELMFAHASSLLRVPNLKIGTFDVAIFENETCREFLHFLRSLNLQLNVRSVEVDMDVVNVPPIHGDTLLILRLLKPKCLHEISLDTESITAAEFDEIVEMQQWKMAKNLCLDIVPELLRMEEMLHFEDVEICNFEFTDRNLAWLNDILLKSAHLEFCRLDVRAIDWHDQDELDPLEEDVEDEEDDEIDDEEEEEVPEEEEAEKRIDSILSQNPAYDAETRRFRLPNSRDYFQLEHEKDDKRGTLEAICFRKCCSEK